MTTGAMRLLAVAAVVCSSSALAFAAPLHEKETAAAWAVFKKGDYKEAIRRADICIDEFFGAADRRQKAITEKKERIPLGRVNAKQKEAIFKNGPLNDVATCLFIKGKAAEAKGDRKGAVAAYRLAVKLKRGRCWDPQGWFWSPAESASDRLEILSR